MAGLPGAGKSSQALALGRALHWPVFDKDTLKSPLLGLGIADQVAGAASYQLMLAVGRDLLVEQGLSVILDSPTFYPSVVEQAAELARQAGGRLRVVLCLADRDVRDARTLARVAKPSQPQTPSEFAGNGRERFGHLPAGTLVVRTARPVEELVAEVLAQLQAGEVGGGAGGVAGG
jgi:predicted kinase